VLHSVGTQATAWLGTVCTTAANHDQIVKLHRAQLEFCVRGYSKMQRRTWLCVVVKVIFRPLPKARGGDVESIDRPRKSKTRMMCFPCFPRSIYCQAPECSRKAVTDEKSEFSRAGENLDVVDNRSYESNRQTDLTKM